MKNNTQLISNMGLYYACYELSKRGWNVMPTARNAKGADIVIYSQDAKRMKSIQVKSSTKSILPTVDIKDLFADYVIIITKVKRKDRDIYICNKDQIKDEIEKGWIQRSAYKHFINNWKSIGNGYQTALFHFPVIFKTISILNNAKLSLTMRKSTKSDSKIITGITGFWNSAVSDIINIKHYVVIYF